MKQSQNGRKKNDGVYAYSVPGEHLCDGDHHLTDRVHVCVEGDAQYLVRYRLHEKDNRMVQEGGREDEEETGGDGRKRTDSIIRG